MPLLLLLVLPLVLVASLPLVLLQRYRMGRARRLARPWVNTVTLVSMIVSTVFFLAGAAVTAVWIPGALAGAAAGLAAGAVAGVAGLLLTRWEPGRRTLYYTPNRWIVLALTLLIAARVVYGLSRSWMAAQSGLAGLPVVERFGIPHSLGAGGTVIGYYLTYAVGLRRRIRQWQRPLLY